MPDPPNLTPLYEHGDPTIYQDGLKKHLVDHEWPITSGPCYIGPEGVALENKLTSKQSPGT